MAERQGLVPRRPHDLLAHQRAACGSRGQGCEWRQPFEAIPGESLIGLPIDWEPNFVPDAGTMDQLLVSQMSLTQVGNEFVNLETGDSYNPALPEFGSGYVLQLHNGTQLTIDGSTGDLDSIAVEPTHPTRCSDLMGRNHRRLRAHPTWP